MRGGLPASSSASSPPRGARQVVSGCERRRWHAGDVVPHDVQDARGVASGDAQSSRLLFNASGLDRGRLWINGHTPAAFCAHATTGCSRGRRGACATQTLYYLPASWLAAPGPTTCSPSSRPVPTAACNTPGRRWRRWRRRRAGRCRASTVARSTPSCRAYSEGRLFPMRGRASGVVLFNARIGMRW